MQAGEKYLSNRTRLRVRATQAYNMSRRLKQALLTDAKLFVRRGRFNMQNVRF